MIYKNIREAHSHFKYPGSYQHGSIYVKDYGIVRSYSNGCGKDFLEEIFFFYKIKTMLIILNFLKIKLKIILCDYL